MMKVIFPSNSCSFFELMMEEICENCSTIPTTNVLLEKRKTKEIMAKPVAPVRFYPNEYPAEGEKVWVKVMNVSDTSATVQLLEYGNHEGMIPYTEFTRLRIRSIGKIIKAGRMEAVQVLRVDKEKRYIDLSKKQVTPNEAKKCEERYLKARDVHSIVCHAADAVGMSRQQAMEMVAFPLYLEHGSAWESLKLTLSKPSEVFDKLDISDKLKEAIVTTAQHRLKNQPVKLRVDLEITCFGPEGVNAIREVLRVGQHVGEDLLPKIPLSVSIVAPPSYIVRAHSEHREEGLKRLYDAVAAMTAAMEKYGGSVKQIEAPRVLGDEAEDEKGGSSSSSSSEDDDDEEK